MASRQKRPCMRQMRTLVSVIITLTSMDILLRHHPSALNEAPLHPAIHSHNWHHSCDPTLRWNNNYATSVQDSTQDIHGFQAAGLFNKHLASNRHQTCAVRLRNSTSVLNASVKTISVTSNLRILLWTRQKLKRMGNLECDMAKCMLPGGIARCAGGPGPWHQWIQARIMNESTPTARMSTRLFKMPLFDQWWQCRWMAACTYYKESTLRYPGCVPLR